MGSWLSFGLVKLNLEKGLILLNNSNISTFAYKEVWCIIYNMLITSQYFGYAIQ